MADTFILKDPENFAPFTVKYTTPDGKEAKIKATYKYRSRKEYAVLLNGLFHNVERDGDGLPDFSQLADADMDRTVGALLDSLSAWDVPDFEITRENLLNLADKRPAIIDALWRAYGAACNQGRLGN